MGVVRSEDSMLQTGLSDPRLPGLAQACNTEEMAPRLRALLGAHGTLRVQLLKHVAGKRAVLLYRFSDGPSAVGKVLRKDRAPKNQAIYEALAAALPERTRTPKPLACWEDLGLLLQEHMPGAPLGHWSQLSGTGDGVERMARALADLHGLRLGVGAPATLADHIRRTCHPGLDALRQALPHLGALLRQIESGLFEAEERQPVQLVPSHGDYGPGQILVTADQVSLMDLDGFAHSDAALDVANVLVGIQVHAGLEARDLGRRFLECYLVERELKQLTGLPHYQAFAFQRRAMILLRRRPAGWEEQVLHLCGRARQCLAERRSA